MRAVTTAGHSIVFGYLMAIALLLHLGLRNGNPAPRAWMLMGAALGAGLVASVSRGPWVGAAVGVLGLTLAIASRQPGRRLVRLVLPAILVAVAVMVSPWGDKVVAYLPFVGNIDAGNVSYRQTLFEVSMKIIAMDPWFGSPYFMYSEPMQELRVGNLVDVVNTYLLIALRFGTVGLVLFGMVFATAAWQVVSALRRQPAEDTERFAQGQAILGMLFVVLLTIATASDVLFVPIAYWCAAGLAIGYGRLVANEVGSARSARPSLVLGPT